MGRIQNCFDALQRNDRKALIPYITAGDPDPSVTVKLMHALVEGGADIIELGVPFSDPMADGPTIQRATERALRHHTSLHSIFEMVSDFRNKDQQTPIVLMGYLNPIEVKGYEKFARQASQVGVDGVLTVDLPHEEMANQPCLPPSLDYQTCPHFEVAGISRDSTSSEPCRPSTKWLPFLHR